MDKRLPLLLLAIAQRQSQMDNRGFPLLLVLFIVSNRSLLDAFRILYQRAGIARGLGRQ
jgi:hypothetical protein